MKKTSRLFLFIGLALVLLTTACGANDDSNPDIQGTLLPTLQTSTPAIDVDTTTMAETVTAETSTGALETPTLSMTESVPTQATIVGTVASGITQTVRTPGGIPVTGQDIVLVECQFCVDTMAHALLVLPDTATFKITSPDTSTTTSSTSVTATTPTCTTVQVNNGQQVVLCSGPERTPLTINICTNANTCVDFPVDLLACPLVQSVPGVTGSNESQMAPGTATPTP